MVTKKEKANNGEDVWFLFDLRGEYHGHIAVGANGRGVMMLKKGDYDKYLLSLGKEVGEPEEQTFNHIVKDINVNSARDLFDDEGFTVRRATGKELRVLKQALKNLMRDHK